MEEAITGRARGDRFASAAVGASIALLTCASRLAASSAGGHGEAESEGISHVGPWVPFGYGVLAALIIIVLAWASTRKLSLVPGKLQNLMEMTLGGLEDFFISVIGPEGHRHIPLLITFFLYILIMNLFGLTGVLVPPTSSLNMTIALALLAIVYVQIQGVRANGLGGYIRHFAGEPLWLAPLMFPLHIISEVAKPLSLSFRLFGNIFGEEIVMVQLALLGPLVLFGSHVLPIQFPLLVLGLLKCIIQAVVFTTLVAVYIAIMTEHSDSHEDHGAHSEVVAAAEVAVA